MRLLREPPLLAIIEGRKPRPRRIAFALPKELALHMAVAKLLRDHCRLDWEWTHVPLGEARDARTAAKLKCMGARPGWPDFVLLAPPNDRMHCVELKRAGGKLTDTQEEFRKRRVCNGTPYIIADNLDLVLLTFLQWNCLRRETCEAIRVGLISASNLECALRD